MTSEALDSLAIQEAFVHVYVLPVRIGLDNLGANESDHNEGGWNESNELHLGKIGSNGRTN